MDLVFLQKNYVFVGLAIVIALVFTFISNLILSQDNESRTYIKTISVSAIISSLSVYVHLLEPVLETIITDPVPF